MSYIAITNPIYARGLFKLEKTFPGTVGVWNSVRAPLNTGVIPDIVESNLKILDLKTLKVTRELNDIGLDDLHEVKLSLQATYFNENAYRITGTANLAGIMFQVRSKDKVGVNERSVPQTVVIPPFAYLEFLDADDVVVWDVSYVRDSFAPPSWPQQAFGGFMTDSRMTKTNGTLRDGYSVGLIPAP